MKLGDESVLGKVVLVAGVAALWAVITGLLQGMVAQSLSYSLSGSMLDLPRWWRFSWLPWPSSIAIAIVFMVAAAIFAGVLSRGGVASSLVICGVVIVVACVWTYTLLAHAQELGGPDPMIALSMVRYTAPLSLSATLGSLLGVLLGSIAGRRAPLTTSFAGV